MTESMQFKAKSISRIACYGGAAILCLIAISYANNGRVVRWILAVMGLAVGTGVIRAFYRFSEVEVDRQIASERFVAALAVGVLSVVVVAVNVERLIAPLSSPCNNESVSVTAVSSVESKAAEPKNSLSKPKKTKIDNATKKEEHEIRAPNSPQMPPRLAKKVDEMLIEADKAVKDGNSEEAETLLVQVLDMMDIHAPRDLPQRGQVVTTLARLRFKIGKIGEGIEDIDQHIARLEANEITDAAVIASFNELAGTLLGNSGAFAESVERFRQVYDIQFSIKADPAVIASTHAKLAISYAKSDDKSAAKQELDSARELLRTAKPDDFEALRSLERIAKEYEL